jgi:hypothetical protein
MAGAAVAVSTEQPSTEAPMSPRRRLRVGFDMLIPSWSGQLASWPMEAL